MDYIAENVTTNVRQLEGTLNKILAYRDLLGDQVDEESVGRAVRDMLKRSNEYVPSPKVIISYICSYYNIDEETLRGQSRSRDVVAARQLAMYLIRRMHATVNKIRLVLLLFGGALLVISLILLSNTIRLAIFSKRYLINTMKLVGATKWFIMRPFLGSSLTQGILAGTAASALFGLAVYGLNEAVPELMTIAEAGKIAIILGSMIAGGIIISGLFTFAALNKFINMKSNKIYLY